MDLHNKLSLDTRDTIGLDGAEKILLAELTDAAVTPARIAVVDAGSPLLFDELAHLFPSAQLVAHNDSLVAAVEIDRAATSSSWADRFERPASATKRYPEQLFAGTDVVLVRLPKSLDHLEEFTQCASDHLAESALVLAAERTKYMTPSQNTVLATYFREVSASLGRFKSRALRASQPRQASDGDPVLAQARRFPRSAYVGDVGLTVVAHGGVFAGTKLDIGTRLLVDNFEALLDGAADAVDFVDAGCGTGVLSARIAQLRPHARVTAVDVSLAAVLSTQVTAAENGYADRITALQDDALSSLPSASADVIVCNPPFHTGTALDTDVAHRMFANAGRVLRSGGQLWTVYNSPLPYTSQLKRSVGLTRVVASNRKFTVTVSLKS